MNPVVCKEKDARGNQILLHLHLNWLAPPFLLSVHDEAQHEVKNRKKSYKISNGRMLIFTAIFVFYLHRDLRIRPRVVLYSKQTSEISCLKRNRLRQRLKIPGAIDQVFAMHRKSSYELKQKIQHLRKAMLESSPLTQPEILEMRLVC
jgi:hypothetical protein